MLVGTVAAAEKELTHRLSRNVITTEPALPMAWREAHTSGDTPLTRGHARKRMNPSAINGPPRVVFGAKAVKRATGEEQTTMANAPRQSNQEARDIPFALLRNFKGFQNKNNSALRGIGCTPQRGIEVGYRCLCVASLERILSPHHKGVLVRYGICSLFLMVLFMFL